MAHHRQPRPIQKAAARVILEGGPVLLCSATASGKTEAYAAPLTERFLAEMSQGELKVLVVSPTRALVNDLYRRLKPPLEKLKVGVARRTGDHPSQLKQVRAGLVLTTPESLDSLLSRHPRWLGSIRALVLDELHVLHGTPRGHQLRFLAGRLDRVVEALGGEEVQRVGASATVAEAEQVAAAYLGPGAQVLGRDSQRDFELAYLEPREGALLEELLEYCRRSQARKVLVFTPSRADAESLAAQARGKTPFQQSVWVHHGSLSRQERERVESNLLRSPMGLCFATNTLELGIDIGDTELVAMLGPPPDAEAFLQRLGRSGRRQGLAQGLALCRTQGERQEFAHLEAVARNGHLSQERRLSFRSVLVQQCFSLCFQNPSRFLTPSALAARSPDPLGETEAEELLDHLCEREWFDRQQNRYLPTQKLHELFEKATMHHNIESTPGERRGVEVVDASGRALGEVHKDHKGQLPETVTLAGRTHHIKQFQGGQVRARGAGESSRPGAGFRAGSGPVVSREHGLSLARHFGLAPNSLVYTEVDGGVGFAHFLGSAWTELVGPIWKAQNRGAELELGPLVGWAGRLPDFELKLESVRKQVEKPRAKLLRLIGGGPWRSELPPHWLARELEEHLGVEALLALADQLEPESAQGPVADWLLEAVRELLHRKGEGVSRSEN